MHLLGGWRIAQSYGGHGGYYGLGSGMAIDFDTNTLYLVGHPHEDNVAVCDLPPLGEGPDPDAWPVVKPRAYLPQFWDSEVYDSGQGTYPTALMVVKGKLYATFKTFYPVDPLPTTVICGADGSRHEIPLPRQRFAGFVKTYPNGPVFLGGNAYSEGQGAVNGPTLALPYGGGELITWSSLIWTPGEGDWDTRCPRPADYWPAFGGEPCDDYWIAWKPRDADGDGAPEGRWCADRVYGCGIWDAEGVWFWARQGTGALDYRHQTPVFAGSPDLDITRVYRFDPETLQLLSFQDFLDGFGRPIRNPIKGTEVGPDGRRYLLEANGWQMGFLYATEPLLRVYAPPPGPATRAKYAARKRVA